jgi:hypothetical protein
MSNLLRLVTTHSGLALRCSSWLFHMRGIPFIENVVWWLLSIILIALKIVLMAMLAPRALYAKWPNFIRIWFLWWEHNGIQNLLIWLLFWEVLLNKWESLQYCTRWIQNYNWLLLIVDMCNACRVSKMVLFSRQWWLGSLVKHHQKKKWEKH